MLVSSNTFGRKNGRRRNGNWPENTGTWLEERGAYVARFARTSMDLRAVRKLRVEVFAADQGQPTAGTENGLDVDEETDHLMVIERASGACVGSCPLLTRESLGQKPNFNTPLLFDLSSLDPTVIATGVERGRADVAVEHRNGGVFRLLLRGIGAYLAGSGKRFLFGCESVRLEEAAQAALTVAVIEKEGWFDSDLEVVPTSDYAPPVAVTSKRAAPEIPALLYAYCALGARLAASPAYDSNSKTLDFFVLLDLDQAEQPTFSRYCGPQ
jgi:putative hemolysin